MERYRTGDKVRIVPRHRAMDTDMPPLYTDSMGEYGGRVVTLTSNMGPDSYGQFFYVKEDDHKFMWHSRWFEPVVIDNREIEG